MQAREDYGVHLPHMYATPGYHMEAEAFNRVQRGHQNMFESLSTFTFLTLVGGLKYILLLFFLVYYINPNVVSSLDTMVLLGMRMYRTCIARTISICWGTCLSQTLSYYSLFSPI